MNGKTFLPLTPQLYRYLRNIKPRGDSQWARLVKRLQKQQGMGGVLVSAQDMKTALRLILNYGNPP